MSTLANLISRYLARPEKAHARLGWSKSDRWTGCPGSPREESRCAPKAAGKYADEGTDAHLLGEICLDNASLHPTQFVGLAIRQTRITAEMAEHVAVYVEAVRTFVEQLGPDATLIIEGAADTSFLHKDVWGTMDAAVIVPFVRAVVIDFKYGVQPVEPSCDQLKGYALAAWRHYSCDEVVAVICQPRATDGLPALRAHTYQHAALEREAARFAAAALATEQPDAPLVAGPHCKYCLRAPTCPKLHERSLSIAQSDFAAASVAPPPPHTLTPAQLRLVLDQWETIEAWGKSVRAYALASALAGTPPIGWKLVAGRKGNRKWSSDEAAVAALLAAHVDPYDKTVISPAAAEKLLGDKAVFAATLGDLVVRADGEPALVPESDKRPALPFAPSLDFSPVSTL